MKRRKPINYPSDVDPEKFADALESGQNIKESMVAAGYAQNTANNGVKMLSAKCITAAKRRGILLGRKFTAEEQGDFVRGQLIANAIKGKDQAVKSLELLGKDRRVNLFTPDSQVGLIVLQAPPEMVALEVKEPPMLGEPVDVVEG